jgi:UDP-N-acetylmuramoylalanine--D-glutamate ligase
MLKESGRRVWVGGNIGISLLDTLAEIEKDDVVVVEISSFQLDMLEWVGISPTTCVVTNLCENHLDRHGTMERYAAAKRKIFAFQKGDELAVLNRDDVEVAQWVKRCPGRVAFFSRTGRVDSGAFMQDDVFRLAEGGKESAICRGSELLIPGWFSQENVLAAICAASEHGARPEHMAGAIRSFRGVEHRLEFVAEIGGVKYYNDSIATNPKSTIAALDALAGNIVLLAGGYDKKLPLEEVSRVIAHRCKELVLVGETAPAIARLVEAEPGHCPARLCRTFDEAVETAHGLARYGETVLLSPACASFDMFRNFAERGNRFKELVRAFGRL